MADPLEEYWRKRDFKATAEPEGEPPRPGLKADPSSQPLQFCIQKHAARRLHYDFRLELNGTLKSWAVPKGPSLDPKSRRLAVHVEDHPLEYASFEGSIPEGEYGAGNVIVWDQGTWTPLGDPEAGYKKGRLKFELRGEKLSGAWNLVRTGMSGQKEQWFLIKSGDDAARPEDEYSITEARPDSVLSDRTLTARKSKAKANGRTVKTPAATRREKTAPQTLSGARKAPLPDHLSPQLATLVDAAPAGDWRYEVKFDGYRILARIDRGEVRLFTRKRLDWTDKMPAQAEALSALALDSAWLDGEVVVPDETGLPRFQALQNAMNSRQSDAIIFYLFDIPYLNGQDLRAVPVEQRRAALAGVLEKNESELLRMSEDFAESGEAMLNSACQLRLEGLIGKRAGSRYTEGRTKDWIKLKCTNRQEFVLVGYTEPKNSRSHFGALLLGLHDESDGSLRYAGKVGTGFDAQTLTSVYRRIKPLEVPDAPVSNAPTGTAARGTHWLRPELLAEVAYTQLTDDGIVRHAVFHGLREDKAPQEIVHEKPRPRKTVEGRSAPRNAVKLAPSEKESPVKISHAERVIDPESGTTKGQLAAYYSAIAQWIRPHLQDRPLAMLRAPDGIGGELFFQKHGEKLKIPGMTRLEKGHAGQPVMMLNSAEAVVGAVQMNAIELHTWNATSADLDHPDRFVLDLDPDPALPWQRMLEATQLTLTVLDQLGLAAFLKTSGGKGIHIVVPLQPEDDWASVKTFSRAIVKHIAKLVPDRFTAVSGPKNRVGRIFIDYLRNSHGATTVCAYSARARPGLAVSVPIARDELEGLEAANQWTVHNLPDRLEQLPQDPWQGYSETRQTITDDMRSALGLT